MLSGTETGLRPKVSEANYVKSLSRFLFLDKEVVGNKGICFCI